MVTVGSMIVCACLSVQRLGAGFYGLAVAGGVMQVVSVFICRYGGGPVAWNWIRPWLRLGFIAGVLCSPWPLLKEAASLDMGWIESVGKLVG